jgi:hypothetical protein
MILYGKELYFWVKMLRGVHEECHGSMIHNHIRVSFFLYYNNEVTMIHNYMMIRLFFHGNVYIYIYQ